MTLIEWCPHPPYERRDRALHGWTWVDLYGSRKRQISTSWRKWSEKTRCTSLL